jgi:TolB-like protein
VASRDVTDQDAVDEVKWARRVATQYSAALGGQLSEDEAVALVLQGRIVSELERIRIAVELFADSD